MKKIIGTLTAVAFAAGATASFAACDAGERVVKLSHVTGGTTHPKVVAANNLAEQKNYYY
jgi:C4-dicarboxylate-binding protein DctP